LHYSGLAYISDPDEIALTFMLNILRQSCDWRGGLFELEARVFFRLNTVVCGSSKLVFDEVLDLPVRNLDLRLDWGQVNIGRQRLKIVVFNYSHRV
jgi:hypothetical protein